MNLTGRSHLFLFSLSLDTLSILLIDLLHKRNALFLLLDFRISSHFLLDRASLLGDLAQRKFVEADDLRSSTDFNSLGILNRGATIFGFKGRIFVKADSRVASSH